LEKDRKLRIQAAIIRTMKRLKVVDHDQLLAEVNKELLPHMKPEIPVRIFKVLLNKYSVQQVIYHLCIFIGLYRNIDRERIPGKGRRQKSLLQISTVDWPDIIAVCVLFFFSLFSLFLIRRLRLCHRLERIR
jgi:Cullin protein neddylation domain